MRGPRARGRGAARGGARDGARDGVHDAAREPIAERQGTVHIESIAAGGDAWLNDPASPQSFASCKLDLTERETHGHTAALHRDLIALRRNDPVFGAVCSVVDGAVLAEEAFALRYSGAGGDERLLIVNFGRQLELSPCPEPLLAPPAERDWGLIFSSDDVAYGGEGTLPTEPAGTWRIAGHAALVFAARHGTTRAPALPGQREINSSSRR